MSPTMVQGLRGGRLLMILLVLTGVVGALLPTATFGNPSPQSGSVPVVVDEAITVTDAPLSSGAVVIAIDEAITVTDASFSSGSAVIAIDESIRVTDAFQPPVNPNQPPTAVALSNVTVAENEPSGTTVGSFSTTDLNAADTHTYSLAAGTGDTGNASFTISGNVLKTATVFDFETKSSYAVRVRATDNGSPPLFFEQQFTITITDVSENQAPVAGNDTYQTNKGSALTRSAAQGVLSNDTDPEHTTLTVASPRPLSGPANGSLTLNADGSFTYTPGATFVGSDSFTYQATDGQASSNTATVTIQVIYDYGGFLGPIAAPPALNTGPAGRAFPVKFSLGSDQGLAILASGYPKSQKVDCSSYQSAPTDPLEETRTAGSSGLSYDARTGQYTYVWKTERSWAGTCRRLDLKLTDGTTYSALFKFN